MNKRLALMGAFVSIAVFAAPAPVAAGHPPAMAALTLPPAAMYTADSYGPVHPDQSSVALDTYPVFAGPLARAAHAAQSIPGPQPGMTPVAPPYSGLVLDAFGGLHVFNASAKSVPTVPHQGPYFSGHDIARDFVFSGIAQSGGIGFGGYILDGYGGVHAFAAGPDYYFGIGAWQLPLLPTQFAYFAGQDVARKIVILADHSGGYVLDAFGGIHPWTAGGTLPVAPTQYAYWPNQRIARDIWIDPSSTVTAVSGYVLDAHGGVHPFWGGTASAPAAMTQHPYFPNQDIARAMWFAAGSTAASSAGYILDGYGGIHPFASQGAAIPAVITDHAYWPGRDVAIALIGG